MNSRTLALAAAMAALLLPGLVAPASAQTAACPEDNGGITLSPGFCATVFADKLGHARHLAVAPNGVVYVNTWSGRYYSNDTPPPGGFLIALQSTKNDGHADSVIRFGPSAADGNAGGTGIAAEPPRRGETAGIDVRVSCRRNLSARMKAELPCVSVNRFYALRLFYP